MLGIYLVAFLLLIFLSVPIAFSLGMATVTVFWLDGQPLSLFAQRLWTGLDKFTLVALPLFILAGELMSGSGILARLLDFSRLLVGRIKGGLLHINILVSMFFGGINGSAIADTSAVGAMLIKATEREYGEADTAAAVTAVSSVIGPIIPPSLPMLIYAFAAGNVSIAALFLAGVVPGVLLGVTLLIATAIIAHGKDYPRDTSRYSLRDVLRITGRFTVAAVLPVIMVAGVVGGFATPTEAGSIAILYALFAGFFLTRELTWAAVFAAMERTVLVTAVVMIIIAFGNVSTWWLTIEGVPRIVAGFIQGTTTSPIAFIAIMLVVYLIVGLFIEQAAAMVMLVPIFAPLATSYGIDPVQFGLFTCMTLALGLVTPPVGLCLFVAASIGGISVGRVVRAAVPYLLAMLMMVLLIGFVPQIYLWLPRWFGY